MNKLSGSWLLLLIVFIALILRFWGLGLQSYWLDECHTAVVSDPGKPWSWLFYYLNCCEYHPPLLYISERIMFGLFGYTDYVGRIIPALTGTLSVWAVFLLGREIYNRRVGLMAASLTTINYFNIWYSQDARTYILAFLFSTLSYVFFIRFLKKLDRGAALLYALFTLLLLYSHYFSLFVLASQIGIAGFFYLFILDREKRRALFRNFALSGLVILIGYSPWLPFLLSMSAIDSIWMSPPAADFVIAFFYEYFGNSDLLRPLLILLLIFYFIRVFRREKAPLKDIRDQPLLFSFLLFLFWISFTYLLPYLRSVLLVPMLLSRYTIVAVPAILVILAISMEEIRNAWVKYAVFSLFVILSLTSLIFINKHYNTVKKTQFREMTAFISEHEDERFPMINELTAWQNNYYLRQFDNEAPVLTGKKEDLIDSILQKTSEKYDLDAFWIIGAHGDQPLEADKRALLEESYYRIKKGEFYDAWAELYTSRSTETFIDYHNYDSSLTMILDGEWVIPVWAGAVTSLPVPIQPGQYQITVTAKGTPLEAQYPRAHLTSNGASVGTFELSESYAPYSFPLMVQDTSSLQLSIELTNDAHHPESGEDRNIFIRNMRILRGGATK